MITRAADAANELQTYRFEMTGTITQDGETNYVNMQAEFVSPNSSHVILVSDGETEEGIIIGPMEYQRSDNDDLEEHEWSASLYFARNNMVLVTVQTLESLVGLVELLDENINSVSCFHYKGKVDMESPVNEWISRLDPSSPDYEKTLSYLEQLRQRRQDVTFWVGKEDYLLREMDIQYEMIYTEDMGKDTEIEERYTADYTLRFFDFNQPITIESPVVE